ncbi:E domain-containing protein [Staphylococcus aureus]
MGHKIVEFGGEKIPQGHKDIFDPNLPSSSHPFFAWQRSTLAERKFDYHRR